ncbi:MAG: hypothetical protein R3C30_17355, partial [Hyphomonadaceae bacterium]
LITPHLIPRDGATYEDIPHLIFCSKQPKDSALCLFDPDGKGWKPTMWIADTTVPWASRWLYYYELWHFDGVWRGGGVGPATIAEIRAREADKASANDGARPRAENG